MYLGFLPKRGRSELLQSHQNSATTVLFLLLSVYHPVVVCLPGPRRSIPSIRSSTFRISELPYQFPSRHQPLSYYSLYATQEASSNLSCSKDPHLRSRTKFDYSQGFPLCSPFFSLLVVIHLGSCSHPFGGEQMPINLVDRKNGTA